MHSCPQWYKFLILPLTVWPTVGAGLALFAFYNDCGGGGVSGGWRDEQGMCNGTEPLSSGKITTADQILPFFAMTELPTGLPGLVVSGILAATMSTISSGLSSLTAVLVVDFLLPCGLLSAADDTTEQNLLACRILTAVGGIAVIVASLLISRWGGAIFESEWPVRGPI